MAEAKEGEIKDETNVSNISIDVKLPDVSNGSLTLSRTARVATHCKLARPTAITKIAPLNTLQI